MCEETLSFRESFLDLFLVFLFLRLHNKAQQNDSVVYRCPSGVKKYNVSGYSYRILSKSERLKESEEISTKDGVEKLLDFHSTEK